MKPNDDLWKVIQEIICERRSALDDDVWRLLERPTTPHCSTSKPHRTNGVVLASPYSTPLPPPQPPMTTIVQQSQSNVCDGAATFCAPFGRQGGKSRKRPESTICSGAGAVVIARAIVLSSLFTSY
jgi:hypothetical protein